MDMQKGRGREKQNAIDREVEGLDSSGIKHPVKSRKTPSVYSETPNTNKGSNKGNRQNHR